MKKRKFIENIKIIDIADRGKAVGKTEDGKVIFVQGPVPGDVVDILLLKKRKGVFQGIVKKYKKFSPYRTQPVCNHFENCGGCKWQHLAYEKQLEYKDKQVREAFSRIAKVDIDEILPVKGGEKTEYYRNKLEFSFSNKRWLTNEEINSNIAFGETSVLGFHAPGSFDKIIPIEHCHLQPSPSNEIRNFIRDYTLQHGYTYWDARANKGFMRNMVVRTSSLGQTMLIVSFSTNDQEKITALLDAVYDKFPKITSLNYVINSKMNDSIWDLDIINYKGKTTIKEKLGEVEFIISPKSFFQTNTYQSKVLYDIAVDFADLQGNENVLDLYTGIGSIALYIAKKVKKVFGIEVVKEAIEDAKLNAELNDISNATFKTGDVKDVLSDNFEKTDIVFIDPPRAGMHKDVVETLLKLEPEKIVYISCNPSTQARDVALLSEKYKAEKSQAVDMFPHTHHIENVILLEKI